MFCGSDSPARIAKGPEHLPVLLREVLGLLLKTPGRRYLDATFGGGGHTRALLQAETAVTVVAIDCDPEAAERARKFKEQYPGRFQFHDLNFADLDGMKADEFDGVLFDYGVSSYHLDRAERGFSFARSAPADMRINPREGQTAADFLETAPERELVRAVREYGEERAWRQVVRAILAARGTGALGNTSSLAKLITNTIPAPVRRRSKVHPATKTFQGVRIAINRELEHIKSALPKAFDLLVPGGVLAAISFHSLEDRIVKRYFRQLCGQPLDRNDSTPVQMRSSVAEALTRRPIMATEAEKARNPRSRSAKLRAVRKQIGLN